MIYLDNNATTKVHPEVLEAMLPFYTQYWGNASSLHPFGAQVGPHLDRARQQVADLLEAQRESEIIFTSSGTESNNLAIRGVLQTLPQKKHLITTTVEHSSVYKLCQKLETEGYEVTWLTVQKDGGLDLEELKRSIRPDTALASIMWANNETGILFPIEEIAQICEEKNILFHTDAVQAAGKVPIDLRKVQANLLSISGHKIGAPKGIGALYLHRGTKLQAQLIGGSQERGRRAGTENVAGMIALGKAAEIMKKKLKEIQMDRVSSLRDFFEEKILQKFDFVRRNGNPNKRVPNTASLAFVGLDAQTIALLLGEAGIAVSTGSACSSGNMEPSRILQKMGLTTPTARGTVRFSLSAETTENDLQEALQTIETVISRLLKGS
ncbi:MAG: IscS subfamily cysteine desulfurase [Deltaproteobacteria bacterium]|nr:IscS subfamily cysteine desulfurase [Deltaproteobacteria bacterium]